MHADDALIVGFAFVAALLGVWVYLSRPANVTSASLRHSGIASLGVFLGTTVLSPTALGCMKNGCFFVSRLLVLKRIVLPHPYDYYVFRIFVPGTLSLSLCASVVILTAFAVVQRRNRIVAMNSHNIER
jgi:hypothetical protein